MPALTHSNIGGSGAFRWMNCAGSVAAEATLGDGSDDNEYTREGTAAHAVGDHCLRIGHDAEFYLDEWFDPEFGSFVSKPTHEKFVHVDESMCDGVQSYVNHVRGLYSDAKGSKDILLVEHTADLSHLFPNMYGTLDAAVFNHAQRTLYVTDFKYGQGYPVEVSRVDDGIIYYNEQLMFYAVGLLYELSRKHDIHNVVLTVSQPRARHHDGPIRSTPPLDPFEILEFAGDLVKGAKLAMSHGAPLKAGPWCKFCKALADCPEAQRNAMAQCAEVFDDEDAKRIGEMMDATYPVEAWIQAVRAAGTRLMQRGRTPYGWEIGESQTKRKWAHPEVKIASVLRKRFALTDDDLLTPRKLLSPAQIEKQLPKNQREIMGKLAMRPRGTPILVKTGKGRTTDATQVFDDEGGT